MSVGVNEKKKSEVAIILKFVCFCVVCFVLGLFSGKIAYNIEEMVTVDWTHILVKAGLIAIPVLAVLINIVGFILSIVLFKKTKKKYYGINEENDEDGDMLDRVEHEMNYPIIISNVSFILNFIMLSLGTEVMKAYDYKNTMANVLGDIVIAGVILGVIWIMAIQAMVVNFEKSINPEKNGSVFEFDFNKKWENSCDEAEKLVIYKSGYVAFKTTQSICTVLCMIGFVLQFTAGCGAWPALMVGVVMLCNAVSYSVAAMKFQSIPR